MNPIQEKVNALIEERNKLNQHLTELQTEFDNTKNRIIEINGSINVLVELFSQPEESNAEGAEVTRHDPESETNTGADTNEA